MGNGVTARAIRLSRDSGRMNLVEIQLWSARVNVALSGVVASSSVNTRDGGVERPFQFQASNLIDGWWGAYAADASLGYDMWASQESDPSPWVQITLPEDAVIMRVVVVSRHDCCESRDVGDVVSLLDAAGIVRWTTVIEFFIPTAPPAGSTTAQRVPVWAADVWPQATPSPSARSRVGDRDGERVAFAGIIGVIAGSALIGLFLSFSCGYVLLHRHRAKYRTGIGLPRGPELPAAEPEPLQWQDSPLSGGVGRQRMELVSLSYNESRHTGNRR
jgi:hypothetical protein